MTLERNMFGLHAPVRQMMERQLVQQANGTQVKMGGSRGKTNLGLDILKGTDEEIGPGDVLIGTLFKLFLSLRELEENGKLIRKMCEVFDRSCRDQSIG